MKCILRTYERFVFHMNSKTSFYKRLCAAVACLLGPLHGVPVTIKEGFWMTDTPATCAIDDMPFFNDFISTSNAPTVQAYLNAGAVVLGKTNLPIHAADFQSYNPRYGITNNPYDLTRVPGGSSGGRRT